MCVCLDIKPAKIVDPSGSGKKLDDYWEPSKKLLSDSNFVQNLRRGRGVGLALPPPAPLRRYPIH